MAGNKQHINRCLSAEELKAFSSGLLSGSERSSVENHISHCELCSDAVEGLKNVSDINRFSKDVLSINKRIERKITASYFRKGRILKNINFHHYISYASIPASIIIVVGSFFYITYAWKMHSEQLAEKMALEQAVFVEELPDEKLVVDYTGEPKLQHKGFIAETIEYANKDEVIAGLVVSKGDKGKRKKEEGKSVTNEILSDVYVAEEYGVGGLAVFEEEEILKDHNIVEEASYSVVVQEKAIAKHSVLRKESRGIVNKRSSAKSAMYDEDAGTAQFTLKPVFRGGENRFKRLLAKKLKKEESIINISDFILEFIVTKSGELIKIATDNEQLNNNDAFIQTVKSIGTWEAATINDQYVDCAVKMRIEIKN